MSKRTTSVPRVGEGAAVREQLWQERLVGGAVERKQGMCVQVLASSSVGEFFATELMSQRVSNCNTVLNL